MHRCQKSSFSTGGNNPVPKDYGRPFQIFLSVGRRSYLSTLSFLCRSSLYLVLWSAGRAGRSGTAAGRCCGPRCCRALAGGLPWWSARATRQQELEAARTRSAHRSIRRDPSTSRLVLALVLPLDRCIACKILLRPLLLVLGCESCSWFLSVQVARSTECPRRAQKLARSRPWGAVRGPAPQSRPWGAARGPPPREPAVGCRRMGSWPPPLPSWEIFSFFFLLF